MGLTACMIADGTIVAIDSQDEMDAVLRLTGGKQSWIGLKDFPIFVRKICQNNIYCPFIFVWVE